MKTGEETAIQSLHNGKVKSDAQWVGSKGELLFPASVTTRVCVCVCVCVEGGTHRGRYERCLFSAVGGAVECEKTGQLCLPGGNDKARNQDLNPFMNSQ